MCEQFSDIQYILEIPLLLVKDGIKAMFQSQLTTVCSSLISVLRNYCGQWDWARVCKLTGD